MGFGPGSRGDRWDRYVEMFIRRFELDASQQSTARSILRDLKEQRDAYQKNHQDAFDAARQIEDRRQRYEKYRELNEPIDSLYEELQRRLDQIPTAIQKTAAEQRSPTSRPAGVTSRPAGRDGRFYRESRGDRSRRGGRRR